MSQSFINSVVLKSLGNYTDPGKTVSNKFTSYRVHPMQIVVTIVVIIVIISIVCTDV